MFRYKKNNKRIKNALGTGIKEAMHLLLVADEERMRSLDDFSVVEVSVFRGLTLFLGGIQSIKNLCHLSSRVLFQNKRRKARINHC